jgi:hypothetical protein
VRAIRVNDEDAMEAAMELHAAGRTGRAAQRTSMSRLSRSLSRDTNSAAASAGADVAIALRGEDVFVHQLHRRACLLNQTFQVGFCLFFQSLSKVSPHMRRVISHNEKPLDTLTKH